MNPERWERVKDIFCDALERDPADIASFLDDACGGDSDLRAEVHSLLEANAPGDLLENRLQPLKAASAPSLLPGLLLNGRYLLERELGQGGFGKVFLALDLQLHSRRVVVKALLDRNTSDPWFEERFADEIRALAMIDHPGVIGVLDSGRTSDGALYLVMQFAEGQTLHSLLDPGGMPFGRVSRLVTQMAQALGAAHERGIVHRDLKPENVMVQSLAGGEERVRLIDFGIARLKTELTARTQVSRVVGSPAYMAPEQLTGHPCAASDIFGLGVITYELLTGRKPFQAQAAVQLYTLQSNGAWEHPRVFRPDLSERAERILLKALAFQPQDRHASAREFADELTAALESIGPIAPRENIAIRTDASTAKAPMGYDVFVSYSSRDRDFAGRLVATLESRGARCFIAPRDVAAGKSFPQAMLEALYGSRTFLLVLTEQANLSVQVLRDSECAAAAAKPTIVLKVDETQPSGPLAYFLSRPKWVDCAIDPTFEDWDEIESAIRAYVPVFSGAGALPIRPSPLVPDEPDEPLLTEWGASLLFGHTGGRQVRLAAFFTVWALVTCLLSVFGNAGDITVTLAGPGSPASVPVRFGYLYELNGAFTYLFIAPFFVYFALTFVQESQSALVALSMRDQLVVNQPEAAGGSTALQLIGEANRRWMSPWLLGLVLAITLVLIVGAEYLPPKSDYNKVMFGYVQAPWIADYAAQCPNCALRALRRKVDRRIEPLGGLAVDQLGAYRIVPPYYRRMGSAFERAAFVLFMISVLGLEVSFGMFVVWTILKAFFILQLIYRALVPSKPYLVELQLRYTDPMKLFGLESVHRGLMRLVGLIGISVVLEVLSWWTNVVKGSKRTLGDDLYTLGGWGQFLVANYSFVLALMLLAYLFFMSGRAQEAASEAARRIAAIRRLGAGGGHSLENLLRLIGDQSVWHNPRYTIPYVAAPFVYVGSLLILNRVSIAYAVGDTWGLLLRHILGKE